MRPISAGAVLIIGLLGVAACATNTETPGGSASSSVAAGAGSTPAVSTAEARKTACATVKNARMDILSALLMANETLTDAKASKADIAGAAESLKTSLDKLTSEVKKASGQTSDAELKTALDAFVTGADSAKAAITAAGTDATKIGAALDVEAFSAAERSILSLCADSNA